MEQAAASSPALNRPVAKRRLQRDWVEIAAAYALIMSVIWTGRPLQRFLWVVAAAGVVFIVWRSFDGWKAMGFTVTNFNRALWIVGAAIVLAVVAVAVAARMHTLHLPPGGPITFIAAYIAYAIWSGVQQFLLQGFFLLRFLRVMRSATVAAFAAAALFGAAHLPNPILTPITLIWGVAACLLFLRYRNIYPLMIAHAILGITVAITIPGPVDHNMRVGLSYLTYNPYRHSRHFQPLPQP